MRPSIVLFNAISLDGRTTGIDVDMGLFYEIAASLGEDATLAGSDTMLAATPAETESGGEALATPRDGPALVVVDSRGRLTDWPYWMAQPMWGRWIALGSDATPTGHTARLTRLGVTCLKFGAERVDLAAALAALSAEHGIARMRVESGGRLNTALLAAGLVDELHLLVCPVLAGGTKGPRFASELPERLFNLAFVAAEPKDSGTVLLSYRAG